MAGLNLVNGIVAAIRTLFRRSRIDIAVALDWCVGFRKLYFLLYGKIRIFAQYVMLQGVKDIRYSCIVLWNIG